MSEAASTTADQEIYAVWHTRLGPDAGPQSGILILADTGVAFQGLMKAAQQCFPGLQVALADQLPDGDVPGLPPRLILVHALGFRSPSGIVTRCRERFPSAPIGLMVDGAWADVPGLRALVAEKVVQGLLPFNMQINVWLATLWLLLNGGEYFPSQTRTGGQISVQLARPGQTMRGERKRAPAESAARMLSARENEVLELMAEGLQNKLIAVKMDLSEHTVKVHVHNIIRKLNVHNRTQAAAVFHASETRPSYEAAEHIAAPAWLEQSGA